VPTTDKPHAARAKYAAKDFYIPKGVAEIDDRKTRFAKIVAYVAANGGFVTSIPGAVEVVIEVLPDSPIPAYFISRGYEVRPAVPPEGERIIAGSITERLELSSSGAVVAATEDSTKPVHMRVHSGIVRTRRFTFSIG
jgi:hypothetical protein